MPSLENIIMSESQAILTVKDLTIRTTTGDTLVNSLSYELYQGQTLAIVGESGSGKSISSLALLGLLANSLSVTGQAYLADFGELPIEQIEQIEQGKIQKKLQNKLQDKSQTESKGRSQENLSKNSLSKKTSTKTTKPSFK